MRRMVLQKCTEAKLIMYGCSASSRGSHQAMSASKRVVSLLFIDPCHGLQFVPFISGPRNCLGQYFALLEARAVLATLLKVRAAYHDHALVQTPLYKFLRFTQ